MVSLLAASAFFVAIHLFISGTRVRDALVGRVGERAYLALFSVLSVIGLTWMIVAYGDVRVPTPTGAAEFRVVALVLNALAFVFIAFGVLGSSPTAVGGARALRAAEPATAMHRVTRHPMLWGVALWAVVHMAFNPQPAHLVFFGAFLILGVLGPASIDQKLARRLGAGWNGYVAVTSSLPGLAIMQGRNRLVWRELWSWKLAVALGAFAALVLLHGRWFGVPLL